MLEPTSLQEQLEAAREDRLRVLVVGAGIAGLTLAQLLRRDGRRPVLIERAGPDAPSGYMLALMPLVDPVLAELGLTDEYRVRSVPMDRYRIRNRRGALTREYAMGELLDAYGDYRGISRGELMAALATSGGTVAHHTTVKALRQDANEVTATFAAPEGAPEAAFDVVIAADGLHSSTRDLILAEDQVGAYDSDWGGWVVWTEADDDTDLGEELWGAGWFVGTYPVKDRLGVIVCVPRSEEPRGLAAVAAAIRREVPRAGSRMDRVLADIGDGREAYFWPLFDHRSTTWSTGRVGLVGDAAAGFLPTAGIGAGMAIESAAALARRLRDCTPDRVASVLHAHERSQRPRVEAAQQNSRQLARLMFNTGRAATVLRDTAARFVPLSAAIKPIRRLLEDRPT
ncbi:FAD-dependent monooxygenase [Glycomyces sp. TRM65418]|uniref:FAD-dependent oxidoreductase n=1 Tax=Glycomyces sp. TRM65418 TaxID=2867006 RepID=UPI001CE529CC|nr:NAD(P)/FAD-dependent oxidoreductase [Glycomyces sp. TRM65418]MCC3764922.1 FAD-dependent monooxygenase [Glycomyces sp. TRM65418]QZD54563.1 FAD-dependent monooxygenase [Glycomyces sp. TRM65418]